MEILTNDLLTNDLLIKNLFHQAKSVRSLSIQLANSSEAKLLFLEEAIDEKKLRSFIFEPLQALTESNQNFDIRDLKEWLKDGSPVQTIKLETCKRGLLDGKAVLIFNHNYAYLIDCSNWDIRSVGVPLSSSVYEGPASGLTEDLSTNLNLMRNYFRSSDLTITTLSVGKHAAKNMAVVSVEGKTDPDLVSEVITRLQSIDVDDFIVSQIATDALEGKGFLFPRTMTIDRPDACAMALAKGRIVLLVEGSPLALLLQVFFFISSKTKMIIYRSSVDLAPDPTLPVFFNCNLTASNYSRNRTVSSRIHASGLGGPVNQNSWYTCTFYY